jgi:hypothetical protein
MKSIKNNKIFLFVLIIFTFIISPLFVFAAVPPTVKLELATEDQNKQTAKWSWVFNIKTADSVAVVGDGLVTISLFKKNATTGVFEKDTSDTPILINNNIGTFYTGSVLDSLTTYQVKAVYTNQNRTASDTFEKSTAEGIIRDITGTPADRSTVIGSDTPVIITPQTNAPAGSAVSTVYKFLAPIGLGDTIDTTDIGVYFSWIFKLAIGLCAALAVIMIIIASVQYMGDESIFGKTEAKDKILKAILGLLIAIGSWVLLNTINPALTGQGGVNVANVSIVVDLPDAGDGTIDSDFAKGIGSYSTDASISPGVTSAVAKLKQGWVISSFNVYSNNRMLIALKNGTSSDNSSIIDIAPGLSGYSETTQSKTGDRKTPKGSWKILNIKTSPDNKPVYNKTGSNMGASFWLLSPMINGERGIGMHGNKNGTLSSTYGCIRLKNADILALLPYVKVGIPVFITS